MTDAFSAEQLCAYLTEYTSALPDCRVFECIDSTNTEAKRMCADGYVGNAVLVAREQTAGRGRMGRAFYSPPATGAYFSILYTPETPLEDAVRITSAASVAVMRAIRALTGRQCAIKWVNDLYLGGKKVAGILTEAVTGASGSQIIVGIGINLTTEDFPNELASIAGALGTEALPPLRLVAAVYGELERYLRAPEDTSWLSDYRAHSMVIGKPVTWGKGDLTEHGDAVGIDETGALLVKREDGATVRLSTGEITLRTLSQ